MPKNKKAETTKTAETMNLRPPIVTIMGHVDHGKTSILDAIREDYAVGAVAVTSQSTKLLKKITAGESGGITQHIGAYTVEKDGRRLTFIDTPGHEAFTQMRARGGKAADVVILVVAADDGVMPQTKEAIMHAKAANVPIIVALNKSDLPGANPMRVKQQLAENGIAVEGFGGDIVTVETSATKKTGIAELLDVILLITDLNQSALEASAEGQLNAVVIESKHHPKKGVIVSVVVKNGTMKLRDEVTVSGIITKVKSLTDSMGNLVNSATLGDAVEILGFPEVPSVGDTVYRVGETHEGEIVEEAVIEDATLLSTEEGSNVKKLNMVIRADTAGTQEAIVASLMKLQLEDARPNILFAGTGDVKESDILLASTGRAIVVAFKVGVPASVTDLAKQKKVIVRDHEIIYKLIEEVQGALEGVVEIEEAKIKGKGLVIQTFVLPKSNTTIAGTLIIAGKFRKNQRVGLFRGDKDVPVQVSRIKSIHVGPKEVEVANKGQECGLLFKPAIADIKLDDEIEVL
jgi:translation initiation factor IF-2